jgi:hypothetical protein
MTWDMFVDIAAVLHALAFYFLLWLVMRLEARIRGLELEKDGGWGDDPHVQMRGKKVRVHRRVVTPVPGKPRVRDES